MEGTLEPRVESATRRHSARHHVAVLPAGKRPNLPDEPEASILSPVPFVEVVPEKAAGRARPLRFRGAESSGWVMARLARPPRRELRAARAVADAEDERGRLHPVAWAECDVPRLHLLVDLASLRPVVEGEGDPAPAVADGVYGTLLRSLLADAAWPRVGPEVGARISTMMQQTCSGRRDAARRDLEMLRRFVGTDPMPDRIRRHLEELEAIAADERVDQPPEPAHVAGEVRRLTQLVADRAVPMLHFAPDAIHGLVSPRTADARTWTRPLTFRLQLAGAFGAGLRLWDAARPSAQGFAPCLGEAMSVLARQAREHDVYGLVDTVLNFLETNRYGVGRVTTRPGYPDLGAAHRVDLPF